MNNSLSNISASIDTCNKSFNSIFYRSSSVGEEADEEKEEPALDKRPRTKSCDSSILNGSYKTENESSNIPVSTDVTRPRTRSFSEQSIGNNMIPNASNCNENQSAGFKKRGRPRKISKSSNIIGSKHSEDTDSSINTKIRKSSIDNHNDSATLAEKNENCTDTTRPRTSSLSGESIGNSKLSKLSNNNENLATGIKKRGRPKKITNNSNILSSDYMENGDFSKGTNVEPNSKMENTEVETLRPLRVATKENKRDAITKNIKSSMDNHNDSATLTEKNEIKCKTHSEPRKRGRPSKKISRAQLLVMESGAVSSESKIDTSSQNQTPEIDVKNETLEESTGNRLETSIQDPSTLSIYNTSISPRTFEIIDGTIEGKQNSPEKQFETDTSLFSKNIAVDVSVQEPVSDSLNPVSEKTNSVRECFSERENKNDSKIVDGTHSTLRKRGRPPKKKKTQKLLPEEDGNIASKSESDVETKTISESFLQDESFEGYISSGGHPAACSSFIDSPSVTNVLRNFQSDSNEERINGTSEVVQDLVEDQSKAVDCSSFDKQIKIGLDGKITNTPETGVDPPFEPRKRGRPQKKKIIPHVGNETASSGFTAVTAIKATYPESSFKNTSLEGISADNHKPSACSSFIEPSSTLINGSYTNGSPNATNKSMTEMECTSHPLPKKRGRPPKRKIPPQFLKKNVTLSKVDIASKGKISESLTNESSEECVVNGHHLTSVEFPSSEILKTSDTTGEKMSEIEDDKPSNLEKRASPPKRKSQVLNIEKDIKSPLQWENKLFAGKDTEDAFLSSPSQQICSSNKKESSRHSVASGIPEVSTPFNVPESITKSLQMDRSRSDFSLDKTKIKQMVINKTMDSSSTDDIAGTQDIIYENYKSVDDLPNNEKSGRNTDLMEIGLPISTAPKRRGRPPRKLILNTNRNKSYSHIDWKMNSSDSQHQISSPENNLEQPKRKRGRPSKKSLEISMHYGSSQGTEKLVKTEECLQCPHDHNIFPETENSPILCNTEIKSEKIETSSLVDKFDDTSLPQTQQNNSVCSENNVKTSFLKNIDLINNETHLNSSKEIENAKITNCSEEAIAKFQPNNVTNTELYQDKSSIENSSCVSFTIGDARSSDLQLIEENKTGNEISSKSINTLSNADNQYPLFSKRKGRPKKNIDRSEPPVTEFSKTNISCANVSTESNFESFQPTQKRNRRPKKNFDFSENPTLMLLSNDSSIMKKSQTIDSYHEPNSIVKKRGRPRKIIKNCDAETETNLSAGLIQDSDSDNVSLPLKKRKGRPPKKISDPSEYVISGDEVIIEEDNTPGPFPLLSKRKRKPKISLDYVEFSNLIELNSSYIEIEAENTSVTPNSLPRKRGRPKKVQETPEIKSEDLNINNTQREITSEISLSSSTSMPMISRKRRKAVSDATLSDEFQTHDDHTLENISEACSPRLLRRLARNSSHSNVSGDLDKLNFTVEKDISCSSIPRRRKPGRPKKNQNIPEKIPIDHLNFQSHKNSKSCMLIKRRGRLSRSLDSSLESQRKDHSLKRTQKRRNSICCMSASHLENEMKKNEFQTDSCDITMGPNCFEGTFDNSPDDTNISSNSTRPFSRGFHYRGGKRRSIAARPGRRRRYRRKAIWDDDLQYNKKETEGSVNSTIQSDDGKDKRRSARDARLQLIAGRVDAFTSIRNPQRMVTCAVCKESMPLIDYSKKHLPKHNFVCWLEGEVPLPLDDMAAMTTLLNRGKTAFPNHIFRCRECNGVKRSALGYLSHIQFCGKSDSEKEKMLVKCELCGRIMVPASMGPHMYQAHSNHQSKFLQDQLPAAPLEATRQAAARCKGIIANYIESEGPISDSKSKTDPSVHIPVKGLIDTDDVSALYSQIRRRPTKHMKFQWKQNLKRGEPLLCVGPSCGRSFSVYEEVLEHHKDCEFAVLGFNCIKCKLVSANEEEMREHVKKCNPPDSLPDTESSDSEEEDQGLPTSFLFTQEIKLTKYFRKCNHLKPGLNWMKIISSTHFSSEPLYEELSEEGGIWKCLSEEQSIKYMPEKKRSLNVSFKNVEKEEIDIFDSLVLQGGEGIAFCGGPIWGMAWCPGDGEQYLATCPHLSMDDNFQIGSTQNGPSAVHIWSLGNINNLVGSKMEALKFSFSICHDEKAAWEIAWCPSGGRTEKRLGLLALACVSGSIPVYSVPNPQVINPSGSRHYKPEPIMRLELYSDEKWQCSAISWSKLKPHRIVVAGFVNGTIAAWDISNQSKLLCSPCKKIRYPFKIFQAHNSFITGLCLSPESEHYLASSSYDKSFKFWDLNDTTAPRSMTKRGLFTGADWLRHWMMAVSSYDVAYSLSQTSVSLSSMREAASNTIQVISSTNSTAWSVSTNDWLNCIAASYDNGNVMVVFATKKILANQKDKKRFRNVILKSSLEEHSSEKPEGEGRSSSPSESGNITCTSYDSASKKFRLKIYSNTSLRETTTNSQLLQENISEGPIDIYPLNSINKVCWNPNKQAFTYLALGYQSGLLVVLKMSFNSFDQAVIDSVLTSNENLIDPNSSQELGTDTNSPNRVATNLDSSEEELMESSSSRQGLIESNSSHQNAIQSTSSDQEVVVSIPSRPTVIGSYSSRHVVIDSISSEKTAIGSNYSEQEVSNSDSSNKKPVDSLSSCQEMMDSVTSEPLVIDSNSSEKTAIGSNYSGQEASSSDSSNKKPAGSISSCQEMMDSVTCEPIVIDSISSETKAIGSNYSGQEVSNSDSSNKKPAGSVSSCQEIMDSITSESIVIDSNSSQNAFKECISSENGVKNSNSPQNCLIDTQLTMSLASAKFDPMAVE